MTLEGVKREALSAVKASHLGTNGATIDGEAVDVRALAGHLRGWRKVGRSVDGGVPRSLRYFTCH